MQNEGKIFEKCFKKSIPDYCLIQRLHDSPQAFKQSNLTNFTPKNPCDFLVFDTNVRVLYFLELKSTQYKSMSFENIDSMEEQNKMIHKHQIIGLTKFAEYHGVKAGFILNFRDKANETERTYFQQIKDFNKMIKKINKQSFNEIDLILNGAIKINGERKRTRFYWDLNSFFESMKEV